MRELKRSLQEQLLAKLATTVQARSALGEAAHGLGMRRAAPPTLALGVAHRARNQFALAVRVQQRALEHSRAVEDLTKQAKGEVDERDIGLVEKRAGPWHRQRQRPLCIGCSVGHFNVTAGTLGAFVRPRGGGLLAILSNNHVLANENREKKGDDTWIARCNRRRSKPCGRRRHARGSRPVQARRRQSGGRRHGRGQGRRRRPTSPG